jgi:hypothetical protein
MRVVCLDGAPARSCTISVVPDPIPEFCCRAVCLLWVLRIFHSLVHSPLPPLSLPLSPRRTGKYRKGMISASLCTRGSGDRFGVPKPRESGSVIGTYRRRPGPPCVLPKSVPQGQTESGGIVLAVICCSPSAQRRCDPTGRCAYRPSVTS